MYSIFSSTNLTPIFFAMGCYLEAFWRTALKKKIDSTVLVSASIKYLEFPISL